MTHELQRHSLQLTTAAAVLPLSLNEVKSHLGLPDSDESKDPDLIARLRAVTISCERYTRRSFIDTTFTMFMDHFPGKKLPWWSGVRQMANTELTDLTEPIFVPRPPLSSVTSIKAQNEDGTTTTVTASDYIVDTAREPGRIALKATKTWPSGPLQTINGVEILFVAGYGPVGSDVPEAVRHALLLSLSYLRDNPSGGAAKFEKTGESSIARFSPEQLGAPAMNLLQTFKIWKI